jgi:uncharacterized protein (UPF0276 family)
VRTADESRKLRRDTHDEAVPDEVFALIEQALPICPQLESVILEHLGTALNTQEQANQLSSDYLKMRQIVTSNEVSA